ncbi:uncharacterized protein LOC124447943 [Xenia sp. Carnegie-2017]|uniref:uncharacterized protein LOC124447943 n=1 Tax=Xenia sp. Carnegie-2017 TaxID=2897299 RepID=UPI001F038A58|nr:uncharacterized protein LOC124447943 [Xenia sp. Carnegie-2017]
MASKNYFDNNRELETLNTANKDTQPKKKKIDFVLVYNDTDNHKMRDIRNRYEENLKKRGLVLNTVSLYDELEDKNIYFVLVHAPLDPVLFQKAEDMHIQMPLKDETNSEPVTFNSEPQSILTRFYRKLVDKRLDPFTVKKPTVRTQNWNTVTSFSKSNVKAFQKKTTMVSLKMLKEVEW